MCVAARKQVDAISLPKASISDFLKAISDNQREKSTSIYAQTPPAASQKVLFPSQGCDSCDDGGSPILMRS